VGKVKEGGAARFKVAVDALNGVVSTRSSVDMSMMPPQGSRDDGMLAEDSLRQSVLRAPRRERDEDAVSRTSESTSRSEGVMRSKAQQLLKRAALALGSSYATVVNYTGICLCVLTFNKADLLFTNYASMCVVDPGQRLRVEALPDPIGLFVAIVYKAADGYLHYKRWLCKTQSEMVVHSMAKYDIDVDGGDDGFVAHSSMSPADGDLVVEGVVLKGVGKVRESRTAAYNVAVDSISGKMTRSSLREEAGIVSSSADGEDDVTAVKVEEEVDEEDEEMAAEERALAAKLAAVRASRVKGSRSPAVEVTEKGNDDRMTPLRQVTPPRSQAEPKKTVPAVAPKKPADEGNSATR
jgi:hypothetical protein